MVGQFKSSQNEFTSTGHPLNNYMGERNTLFNSSRFIKVSRLRSKVSILCSSNPLTLLGYSVEESSIDERCALLDQVVG